MIYRAGIVGCGRIGCGFDDDPRRTDVATHAGAYVRTPNVRLAALCDLDLEKLERYGKQFGVAGRYQDYREMVEHESLDVLSICTMSDTHREILKRAVGAGVKAIFCEKPMADSLADADAMTRQCAASGVILLVNHKRRFDPFHQRIAAYLSSGSLGKIQQVTCYYTSGLANTGTHLFDLLRFYFGEASWAQGTLSASESSQPADPNVDGTLLVSGIPVVIQACDAARYYLFELTVLGSGGRLRISSGISDALHFEVAKPSARSSEYCELQPAPSPIQDDQPHEPMLAGVRHLIDCVEGRAQPLCGGDDGRKALEIIYALRESAQAGGMRIRLPLPQGTAREAPRGTAAVRWSEAHG